MSTLNGSARGVLEHCRAQLRNAEAPFGASDVDLRVRGDVLARQRRLPAATSPGDTILVADAGAYGMAMANTYNLRALPVEDILDD